MTSANRILIAGVGNVLRGDDGFGVVTAQRLMELNDLPAHVKIIETGIGGMSLVQEMMDGYHAVVLIDACERGGKAGKLYLLEPELPDLTTLSVDERRDYFADTHYATPFRALSFAEAVDSLPPIIRIIGCEPAFTDRFEIGLDPAVDQAVDEAVKMARQLIEDISRDKIIPTDASLPAS